MPHPLKVTDARLKAALRQCDGMQALTAKKLGITRQSVRERINNSPDIQQFIADLDVEIVDLAEKHSNSRIRKGKDGQHLRWYLERKGRARGYATKIDGLPPPPDPAASEKRQTVIQVLVQNLEQRAQGALGQAAGGQRVGVSVSERAAPLAAALVDARKLNGKGNGHG